MEDGGRRGRRQRPLTLAVFAQAAAPGRISVAANGSTTDFVTTNGLKTIHRHVTGNDVVAAQIYFRGGARNVTEERRRRIVAFRGGYRGAREFSKSEINREMARMGTVIDGDSGYDFSVVEMRCVRQNFDRSWQLLTDMILNPACDDKEVALVKDQIISALRQQNDPRKLSGAALQQAALRLAPLLQFANRHGRIGQLSDLRRRQGAPRETASDFADAGGRGRQRLDGRGQKKVEASFGKLQRGEYKHEAPPAFAKASTADFQVVERPVATNYIRGSFAPPLESPDYAPFSIAVNILQQLSFRKCG